MSSSLSYVQTSYASNRDTDLNVDVKMPDIGFITVGDEVPVTLTVTNNSNETRYFQISSWFRPDNLDTAKFQGDTYLNNTVLKPHDTVIFRHNFIARFPDLWWLISRADGFESTAYIGTVHGGGNETKFYVHPSSDRDMRILALSTAQTAEAAQRFPYSTWVAVGAAIASATIAAIIGLKQARINQKNLRLNGMKQVFDLLSGDPYVGYRRTLYHEYCNLKKEGKPVVFNRTDAIYEYADAVEGAFDKAAVLVFSGLVDYEQFFKLYHDKILRFWVAAEEDIASKNKRNRYAGENFRRLVDEYKLRVKELPTVDCSEFKGDFEVAELERKVRAERVAIQRVDIEEKVTAVRVSNPDTNDSMGLQDN